LCKYIKKLAIDLTVQEHLDLGIVYFKNGLYKESLQELEQVGVEHSWTYLSLANKKLGFYKKSMSIFENNYPKYSDNIDEELLWNVIDNYVSIYSGDKKNALYKVLNMAQLNSSKAQDYILYCLCKYVDDKTKQELYRKIYIDFPDGKFASDALANLFWQAYQAKDYKEAKMLGQIHIRDYGGTIASPKVLFWLARLTEKQGHKSEAKSLYQRLIEKYPDDYYAYRANSYLSFGTMSKGSWHTKTSYKLPEKQVIEFPAKFAEVSDDNIKLIENILNLNDYKLLGEIDKNNKIVLSWINYREGNYSTSTLLARDAIAKMQSKPPFSDNIYKLVYPLHYQSVISEQAKINKLDPYLVLALIREESYFNPEAQSNAGARGLMQIMPSTASFIATHSNSTYSGPASLSIPDINIRLGCAYLKYAKKALEKDVLAIASYNGGPGAVNQWKNSLKYISWDEFVENIPYPETREYVKKVFRSYWVYLNVYNIANRL